jgi:hypothetical protein
MKIKLLIDYVGRETSMSQRSKGDVLELDQQPAIELIVHGVAVEYIEKPKKKEVKDVTDEQ